MALISNFLTFLYKPQIQLNIKLVQKMVKYLTTILTIE